MSAEVVAILLAALAAFSGFIAGRQQTTDEIEQIKRDIAATNKRVDGIESIQQHRAAVLSCSIRTLDRLTEKARVAAPCPMQEVN